MTGGCLYFIYKHTAPYPYHRGAAHCQWALLCTTLNLLTVPCLGEKTSSEHDTETEDSRSQSSQTKKSSKKEALGLQRY